MLRKVFLSLLLPMLGGLISAQSPAKLYLQILNACGAGPNLHALVWLGTTNTNGPGSVWTLPRNGPVLKVRADSYFKTQADINKALDLPSGLHANPCNGVKSPKWDVGANVPVSVAGVGGGEASVALSKATNITATATSISLVSMPSLTMEDAINNLPQPHTNDTAFWRVADGKSYAMLSAYSVEGLQITYTLDTSLNVKAQTNIKANPVVNLGTVTNPLNAKVDVSNNGQKVTISIPDAHYMFGEMTPIGMLKSGDIPKGRIMLGRRNWVSTCRTAGLC